MRQKNEANAICLKSVMVDSISEPVLTDVHIKMFSFEALKLFATVCCKHCLISGYSFSRKV